MFEKGLILPFLTFKSIRFLIRFEGIRTELGECAFLI